MNQLFYISGVIAVISALMVITRNNTMNALLYFVLLIISLASIFSTLGAPFAAALQIVVYAGAIMVLFVFVVMMMDLSKSYRTFDLRTWVIPIILAAILLSEFVYTLNIIPPSTPASYTTPQEVGKSLYTHYFIGVELASFLLLAGLVGAMHFGFIPFKSEVNDDSNTN